MSGERGGPQLIPRPSAARPGGPAPWAELDPSRLRVPVDHVLAALRSAGPPVVLPLEAEVERVSAVLVPLFEEDGQTWLVLTRRAQHLRTHKGEVSFPGGRQDPGEALTDTAKREAWEEIGLDPASVEIVAELDHLTTATSATIVVPFVGVLPGRPADLVPNEEVEHVLTLPLSELVAPGTFREELWTFFGAERPMYFFDVVGDTIWGATARILHDFLRVVLLHDM